MHPANCQAPLTKQRPEILPPQGDTNRTAGEAVFCMAAGRVSTCRDYTKTFSDRWQTWRMF